MQGNLCCKHASDKYRFSVYIVLTIILLPEHWCSMTTTVMLSSWLSHVPNSLTLSLCQIKSCLFGDQAVVAIAMHCHDTRTCESCSYCCSTECMPEQASIRTCFSISDLQAAMHCHATAMFSNQSPAFMLIRLTSGSVAMVRTVHCVQVEKEREALRFEMNKAAAQMKEADAAIAAQKAELDKLNQIITEADQVTPHTTMLTQAWLQIVWFQSPNRS